MAQPASDDRGPAALQLTCLRLVCSGYDSTKCVIVWKIEHVMLSLSIQISDVVLNSYAKGWGGRGRGSVGWEVESDVRQGRGSMTRAVRGKIDMFSGARVGRIGVGWAGGWGWGGGGWGWGGGLPGRGDNS